MKSPNFGYLRARSLHHACEVLGERDGEAVAIAGGQSLLAGLNMRLSSPRLLVDIGDLPELSISHFGAAEIRLGALTRHVEVLESEALRQSLPLLPRAVSHVAHAAIRNRGTLGGSLAYADPAAELPACAVVLDATIVIASIAGEREIKATDFFTGLMETALRPGELIVAVRFPVPAPPQTRFAFGEFSRRRGDFAVAGIAASAQIERDRISEARVVYFGCVERAKIAAQVSASLRGLPLPLTDIDEILRAVEHDLDPDDIPGWRASTQLELSKVITRRALGELEQASQSHAAH
jgi:aerobic carbon-monoxide dehydrogenase medium subunit